MKLAAIIALAMLAFAAPSLAIEIDHKPGDSQNVLILKGTFETTDNPALIDPYLNTYGVNLISFDSPGGNPTKAMEYGRHIRALGLNTVQLRQTDCASACAYAFMGGVQRLAEPGSIGVHKSYIDDNADINRNDAVSGIQGIIRDSLGYFREMGVNPDLLEIILSTEGDDIRYLTKTEMAQYGVTTTGGESIAKPPVTASQPKQKEEMTPELFSAMVPFIVYEAWSKPDLDLVKMVTDFYADYVKFYDNDFTKGQVYDEKKKLVDRWPYRAYVVRFGTQKVNCVDETKRLCIVDAIVDWYVSSPKRGKMAAGATHFVWMVNTETYQIVRENGKTIETDTNVTRPDRIIAAWGVEHAACNSETAKGINPAYACNRRDNIEVKLEAMNWCYGRPGDASYNRNWHICGF